MCALCDQFGHLYGHGKPYSYKCTLKVMHYDLIGLLPRVDETSLGAIVNIIDRAM